MYFVLTNTIIFVIGLVIGITYSARKFVKLLDGIQKDSEKFQQLFLLMNRWVKVQQEGKTLVQALEQMGYTTIAIYGMSFVGERLLVELQDSEIKVRYAIDKNASNIPSVIEIVEPNGHLEEVDAIIVTTISAFEDIKDLLIRNGVCCPILSIEDVLFDL